MPALSDPRSIRRFIEEAGFRIQALALVVFAQPLNPVLCAGFGIWGSGLREDRRQWAFFFP
jgi:hypothetical protein